MPKRIIRSPLAREDTLNVYAHIALNNPTVAEEFFDAVDELLDRLLRYPDMGNRIDLKSSRLKDMRVFRVSAKFDHYLVFYRAMNDDIHLVRVLHGSRDIEALLAQDL